MSDPQASRGLHLSTLIAGRGDQVVTVAQLVTLLERVREELLADAQEKSDRLHRQVTDEMATISALSNHILASFCNYTTGTRSTRSRGSSSGRRGADMPPNLDNIDIFQSPDVGASDYLRYLMLLTVMAFIANVPNASLWVGSTTHTHMQRFMPILQKVSGFSLVLFAVRATDAKTARKRTAMGQARALLVKWTLARKVALTREEIQTMQSSLGVPTTFPVWLESFGTGRATRRRVSEIIDLVDNTEETRSHDTHQRNGCPASSSGLSEIPGIPSLPHGRRPNKRRRQNGEIESDPVLDAQTRAIRAARTKLLRALSHARTDVRRKLFTSLLFVFDRIWAYENPAVASANGYSIIFASNCAGDDEVPILGPDMVENAPWSIPLALKRGQDTEEKVRDTNLQRFADLQRAFPGLAVKLRYKVEVRRNPSDTSGGAPEFNDPELAMNACDDISLHSVAASCLLGGSRASDFNDMLQTSELSLRAIHVIALGLRGLLKQALDVNGSGPELSEIEKVALGDVSARPVQRGELNVTAMYGSGTRDSGDGTEHTDLEKLRRSKLEMSWSDYKKRVADEAARAEQMQASDGSRSESDNSGEEYDWAENAGI